MLIIRQKRNDKDKCTSKNFVSLPIGSAVVVQCKDGGPWTHGMIQGKGNHNHHDRSHNICITKIGRLVTHNRQHVKPTKLSAEQYLLVQLQKHIQTDPLENILTQLEKQPYPTSISHYTNNAPHSNNITHGHTTASEGQDNSQIKGKQIVDKKKYKQNTN